MGWSLRRGALGVAAIAVAGVMVSTGLAEAGVPAPEMTVEPAEVGYDEIFTVSGSGCFTAVALAMPEVPISSTMATANPDGTWSHEYSIPSEAGISPGMKTITGECLGDVVDRRAAPAQQAGFQYADAFVNLVEPAATTTTTTTPAEPPPATQPVVEEPTFTG